MCPARVRFALTDGDSVCTDCESALRAGEVREYHGRTLCVECFWFEVEAEDNLSAHMDGLTGVGDA